MGAVIISVILIERLSDYRFDAQLGIAIFIWGSIGSMFLLIMAGIHNLILFIMSGVKRKGNSVSEDGAEV